MMKPEALAREIDPFRAIILRVIGGPTPLPFFVIDREVRVMSRGVKMPDDFKGYVKLSEDPLFEHYGIGPDDDMWALSPLGCSVLNVLSRTMPEGD